MCTVGYGDTAPINSREQILCILTILTACGVFGYSMNIIGIIIQEFSKTENEIDSNLYIISSYMHSKQINKEFQYQVRKYLEYYYREISTRNLDAEEKIIGQLSEVLKKTLQIEANKIIIKDSPIFAPNFSDEILIKTIPLIQECRYTPEEIIYFDKQIDDNSIYFIEKGQVEVFQSQTSSGQSQSKGKPIFTLNKGQSFGAYNFFSGMPRQYSVKSLQFSTLLKIKREDFVNLVINYPEEYETYCHIKDNILLNSNFFRIGEKCQSCTSLNHSIEQCPYLHFEPDKLRLAKISNKSVNQLRKNFKRKKYSKQNKFQVMNLLYNNIDQFNDLNASFLDNYEDQYLYLQNDDQYEEQEDIEMQDQSIKNRDQSEKEEPLSKQNSNIPEQQQQTKPKHFGSILHIIKETIEKQNSSVDLQKQMDNQLNAQPSNNQNKNESSQLLNVVQQAMNQKKKQSSQSSSSSPSSSSQSSSSSLQSSEDEAKKKKKLKKKVKKENIKNVLTPQMQKLQELQTNRSRYRQLHQQSLFLSNQRQSLRSSFLKLVNQQQNKEKGGGFLDRIKTQMLSQNASSSWKLNMIINEGNNLAESNNILYQQQKMQIQKQYGVFGKMFLKDFDRQYDFTRYMPWNNLENIIELQSMNQQQYKIQLDKIKQQDNDLFNNKLNLINKNGSLGLIKKIQNQERSTTVRKSTKKKTLKQKNRSHSERYPNQNPPQIKSPLRNLANVSIKKTENDINNNTNYKEIDQISYNQQQTQTIKDQNYQNQQSIQQQEISFDKLQKDDIYNENNKLSIFIKQSEENSNNQDENLIIQEQNKEGQLSMRQNVNDSLKNRCKAYNYQNQ